MSISSMIQEGGFAGVLEEHGVGHFGVASVGGAEAVEQVGGDEVEGGAALLESAVGEFGGEAGAA